jgi:malate dehydrogenase (oxaloacetate-decarboxylating)
MDAFVDVVTRLFPRAMLHWEDIGVSNARRLLDRYRHRLLTFNDDIQGTGVVNLAAVLGAVRVAGTALTEHRVVIFGAGTAGTGIADQLSAALMTQGMTREQARARFWAVDRPGLLTSNTPGLSDSQRRYARDHAEVVDWPADQPGGGISLAEVVTRVRPTILIGTSTVAGAFTEPIVREMAARAKRPIILPMSNPTSLSEAVPSDLIRWTHGQALVATGSPFEPVDYEGTRYVIGQANNALIFPGLGLGVIAARATRVTDHMLAAAAHAVAALVDTSTAGSELLPRVERLRETSVAVAAAVATAAAREGVSGTEPGEHLADRIRALMWVPVYRPLRPV